MLPNLLDNSYSAANVNKFQLDRPKTCRFCTKTDSLDRGPGYKTLSRTRSRLIRAIAPLSDGSHNSQILFYET
ncbi:MULTISPECIES: hypothetical protein [unclassified Microcoleus]|uniref:hypothetical protein n=1 Tax=unclassified Microcoleus TaxID=2642155 RepID=UPI002FD25BF0